MSKSDITDILDLFPGWFYPVILLIVLKYVQLTSRYSIYFVFQTDFFISESNVAVSVKLQLNYHNFEFSTDFLAVLSQVSDPIIINDIHSGVVHIWQ